MKKDQSTSEHGAALLDGLRKLFATDSDVRGKILSEAVQVEMYVDVFLGDYFCVGEDKQVEMVSNFLGHESCSFGLKVGVLERLNIIPKAIKPLKRVMELRNAAAHGRPLPSRDGKWVRTGKGRDVSLGDSLMEIFELSPKIAAEMGRYYHLIEQKGSSKSN